MCANAKIMTQHGAESVVKLVIIFAFASVDNRIWIGRASDWLFQVWMRTVTELSD